LWLAAGLRLDVGLARRRGGGLRHRHHARDGRHDRHDLDEPSQLSDVHSVFLSFVDPSSYSIVTISYMP
jgi:hypothetical protein